MAFEAFEEVPTSMTIGKVIIKSRWEDNDKGEIVRSRWVLQEFVTTKQEGLFASTPTPASIKLLETRR